MLTLTNLEAGEYMLVCTATKHVGAGYSVRATVTLTVEPDEEDTRAVLKRDTTYTTGVSRSYNGTNICNELHEVTYLDGETEVELTNQEEMSELHDYSLLRFAGCGREQNGERHRDALGRDGEAV